MEKSKFKKVGFRLRTTIDNWYIAKEYFLFLPGKGGTTKNSTDIVRYGQSYFITWKADRKEKGNQARHYAGIADG